MVIALFFYFLLFSNVSWIINMKPYGRWKNYKLYILCTLILFNLLHVTVGSKLISTKNELWIQKCCCANSKVFLLIFRTTKRCHQDFNLLPIIIIVIHHFFWTKVAHPQCAFTLLKLACNSNNIQICITLNIAKNADCKNVVLTIITIKSIESLLQINFKTYWKQILNYNQQPTKQTNKN
jgi:hypothetical protein